MRCPVFLLIWLKVTFSVSEVAGNKATGHVTRDSFKKPFQLARGVIVSTPFTLTATQSVKRPQVPVRQPQSAFRTGISDRIQNVAHGRGGLLWRQSAQRLLASDPERLLSGVGVGSILCPSVLITFVDGAGLLQ
jgi:hypothetical protein